MINRGRGSVGLMLLGLVLLLPECGFVITRVVKGITFGIDVSSRLKRAADANTVELARQELGAALTYLDNHGLTNGYTSVLYRSPDEDVGFWHSNLKASLDELNRVKPETTQLERSNVLMKLRETLLDHGSKGDSVTEPDGISVFPSNAGYAVWGWLGLLLASVGLLAVVAGVDD